MAVNLVVDFAAGRFDETTTSRASEAAAARGYRLVYAEHADDRLAAWIDWQFAPSWWSAEARAGAVWYALDASGDIAGFAAFGAQEMPFPWLRAYAGAADVGIFGPLGVAPAHRKTGLGTALLEAALSALRDRGYARALIPAVGYDALVAMYQARTGARVCDRFDYAIPQRYRTTILASGSGTNAQHVFDRVADGRLPLDLTALIANAAAAPVIERARAAGIASQTVVWDKSHESRADYDRRIIAAVSAGAPELVLLLGWMHVLPPAFIERFPDILNVHPAFLPFDPRADVVTLPDGTRMPAFRGAHAVRDALAGGAAWIGASVHRVTAETDRGQIVVRTPLRLDGSAGRERAGERLRPIEHAAVGAAIRRWCFERYGAATGNRVRS